MQFDWWTFGLQTINFIILVWLLKLFLYGPVLAAIKRRQIENAAAMEKAQEAEKAAENERTKLTQQRQEVEATREKILEEARTSEAHAYDKLMQKGQEEIAHLRDLAREDMARESHKVRIELRQECADLAVILARHILQESRSTGLDAIFLEKIMIYLKSMSPGDFKSLQDQLDGTALGIITAEPLDRTGKKAWRSAIGAIFDKKILISFSVDAALIAGADLQFPNGLVRFNWRDSLSQAKAALYERADSP